MPEQEYLLELYAAGSLSVFGEGWEHTTADAFDTPAAPEPRPRWILRGEADTPPSRYLEMGPRDGALLKHFEGRGWDCYAIEPGTWGRRGVNFVENLDQLPNEIDFDVIVASDVLEHVADPVNVVRRLADSLVPTGRMYFSFPNSSSLRASIQKERWRMIRPIGHLHYFSRQSVFELLSRSKLTIRRIESFDLLAPVGRHLRAVASYAAGRDLRRSVGAVTSLATSMSSEAIGRGDQWRVTASW
jgi:SAM-dependent methyltransferase